jgi:hypothetical protein
MPGSFYILPSGINNLIRICRCFIWSQIWALGFVWMPVNPFASGLVRPGKQPVSGRLYSGFAERRKGACAIAVRLRIKVPVYAFCPLRTLSYEGYIILKVTERVLWGYQPHRKRAHRSYLDLSLKVMVFTTGLSVLLLKIRKFITRSSIYPDFSLDLILWICGKFGHYGTRETAGSTALNLQKAAGMLLLRALIFLQYSNIWGFLTGFNLS